jgi:hypothetical protein
MLRNISLATATIALLACSLGFASNPLAIPPQQPTPARIGPWDSDTIEAVFVRPDLRVAQQLKLRFEAQTLMGTDAITSFELVSNARVTRNGQPARLFDLHRGDRLIIQLTAPGGYEVVSLAAFSR